MTTITGEMLIGATALRGTETEFHAVNPATGETLEPAFGGGGEAEVNRACELAWAAFDSYRETSPDARARFLETAAQKILDLGDELVERASAESGLPRARIEGERARTVGQLRLFAEVLREGNWVEARFDTPLPERKPLPRADLRQRHIAVGPVAVFGASNFPLAFSVAGGDTASALAAGCPVVVKAHSAHPGTSELVGRAVQAAVKECGLPEGVFSMLFGSGLDAASLESATPPPREPVKPTALMRGSLTSAVPVSTAPSSRENTPSGSPHAATAACTARPTNSPVPGWAG